MLIKKSERTAPKNPKIFLESLDKESYLNKVLSLPDWLTKEISMVMLNAKSRKKSPVFFKFSLILMFIRLFNYN